MSFGRYYAGEVFELTAGMVYYPYMASIVGKKRGTATYYYLVESARVDGQPKMISEQYVGTADEVDAAGRPRGRMLPDRPGTWNSGRSPPRGGCWTTSAWPASSTR